MERGVLSSNNKATKQNKTTPQNQAGLRIVVNSIREALGQSGQWVVVFGRIWKKIKTGVRTPGSGYEKRVW